MPFRSRTESIYSPRRLKAVEKQKAALQLRIEGKTWYEIADILHYKSHSGPIGAVETALKRLVAPEVNEYRKMTLERLTQLLSVAWPRAVGELTEVDEAGAVLNNPGPDITWMREARAIIADVRALLGTDAPQRQEITGEGGGPIRIEEARLELRANLDSILARVAEGPVNPEPFPRNGSDP